LYRIESKISTKSADYKENREHIVGLVEEFKEADGWAKSEEDVQSGFTLEPTPTRNASSAR